MRRGGRPATLSPVDELLIDGFLPEFDVTVIRSIVVEAPPDETYEAINRADIASDPIMRALTQIRDLPNALLRRLRREPAPEHEIVTFADVADAGTGWVVLGEEPGVQLAVGLVGAFWHRDYGIAHVSPAEFASFARPGYAKVGVSFSVRPYGERRSLLTYEARTATTDEEARRRFRRYWLVIGRGAGLMMSRALVAIKAEAERSRMPALTR
jgi:hypothetical protein